MPPPSEAFEQKALARWLTFRKLLWCHVPNGGPRHIFAARNLQAQGVMPGVPDILIFSPPPASPSLRGVAIELKREGKIGVVSPAQKRWLAALTDAGWATRVARGAAEAIAWLHDLGYS